MDQLFTRVWEAGQGYRVEQRKEAAAENTREKGREREREQKGVRTVESSKTKAKIMKAEEESDIM